MEIKVQTQITKTISENLDNQEIINNLNTSVSSSSSESSDFIVDNSYKFEWELDITQGAAFDEDITQLITESRSDIKMIHVQANKVPTSTIDTDDPAYFDVEFNSVAWGSMSQFEMVNIQSFPDLPFNISNVIIGASDKVILTIFIGVNKA